MERWDSIGLRDEELSAEAIDLTGIDVLEEDIVPCTCCGGTCNCT